MVKPCKHLLTTATGAVFAIGMAFNAVAAPIPIFHVTPNGGGVDGPAGSFSSDFINGNSSELLTTTPGGIGTGGHTGSGWLQFSSFSLTGSQIFPLITGLGTSYGLFISFNLQDTLTSSTLNVANSTYTLNVFNFTVWADPGLGNTFTQANATTSTGATFVDGGTADIQLGSATLIDVTRGTSGFDSFGGAFLNAINTFTLTTAGTQYFTNPVPFFNVAFSELNNTSQGILMNGNLISITNASGGIDFNGVSGPASEPASEPVPEPASLALVGLGLLALGASRRRHSHS